MVRWLGSFAHLSIYYVSRKASGPIVLGQFVTTCLVWIRYDPLEYSRSVSAGEYYFRWRVWSCSGAPIVFHLERLGGIHHEVSWGTLSEVSSGALVGLRHNYLQARIDEYSSSASSCWRHENLLWDSILTSWETRKAIVILGSILTFPDHSSLA